ncbi:MAG: hypothetical protein AAF289_16175 [Cyanobacteria bacterium P01_A01_bin.135]
MLPISPTRAALTAAALAATMLTTSCASTGLLRNRFLSVSADMEVTKLNAPGRYQVSGAIGLPNDTPVAVAALRHLTLTEPVAQNPTGRQVYSLLDYRVVRIADGAWQAELDLWQPDADGQILEAWQRQSDLDWSVQPEDTVVFITIPTPTKDLAELQQRLSIRQRRLDESLLRRTIEGIPYAEITQVDDVPLPGDQVGPPREDPQAINGGWGRRYVLQPEPPNPVTLERPGDRRTTAPATPEEFLR